MTDPQPPIDPKLALLQRVCTQLSEHFDNIQIFATVVTDNDHAMPNHTMSYLWGQGNIHARVGQVREWVMCHDATTAAFAVAMNQRGHQ